MRSCPMGSASTSALSITKTTSAAASALRIDASRCRLVTASSIFITPRTWCSEPRTQPSSRSARNAFVQASSAFFTSFSLS